MIGVYTKRMRSLNEGGKKVVTAWLDVSFRDYLHELKGARLAVFLAIALHSDEDGWSFPSIKLIAKETGYSQDTVNDALNTLCSMTINGNRLLLRFQPKRQKDGLFKSNQYLIFPSLQEQREYAEAGIRHLGHKTGNGFDKRQPSDRNEATVMGFSSTEADEPSREKPMTKNHQIIKNHHTTPNGVPAEKTITTNAETNATTNVGEKNTGHLLEESTELLDNYAEVAGPFDIEIIEMDGHTGRVEEKSTGGYITPDGCMVTPEQLRKELAGAPNAERPRVSDIDLASDGYPVDPEKMFPFKTPAPRVQRTEAERQAVIARAMDTYQRKHGVGGEAEISPAWRNVPVYQGQILTEFYKLSSIAIPKTKGLRDRATYAAETMYEEVGAADAVVKRLRQFFNERADGKHDFTITGPNSVVKVICAMQETATGPKVIRVGG